MPYKTERLSIKSDFLEKRTKLLPCQKEMIVYWHDRGLSQRKLAAMFSVSRRLIQFVLDPEKLKQNKQARLERGGSMQYYNREKHNEYQKKHRKYKNEILSHLA
jgi:hypothetical protein